MRQPSRHAVTTLIIATALCYATTAHAAIWYVNQRSVTGVEDGTTWATAFTTIQPAIDAAAADGGGEIWVAQGVYAERRGYSYDYNRDGSLTLKSGVSLYGGFRGGETAREQRDWRKQRTVIDGRKAIPNPNSTSGGTPTLHVINATALTTAIVDGFTITGGAATRSGYYYDQSHTRGAGIYASHISNSLTVANCVITQNSANDNGSGLYCEYSKVAIKASSFVANSLDAYCMPPDTAVAAGGAAIGCHASDVTIDRCVISANYGQRAGGINAYASSLVVANSSLSGNYAKSSGDWSGGAIFYYAYDYSTTCVISNSIIAGNYTSVTSQWYSPDMATVAINNFRGATILNTVFADNSGANGPVQRMNNLRWGSLNSTNTIANTIFRGSTGAAIAISASPPNPKISACLFDSNPGGALTIDSYSTTGSPLAYATAADINSGVEGASANQDAAPKFRMDTPQATRGTWTATPAFSAAAGITKLTDANAHFLPNALAGQMINVAANQKRQFYIAANTANTISVYGDVSTLAPAGTLYILVDYTLAPGSPCIDAGSNADAPATDITGAPRPQGTQSDIGPIEFSLDTDGDGIPDRIEQTADPDADSLPNYRDPDSDGDGIPDSVEGTDDADNDGTPNYLDLDSDDDGIPDQVEGKLDADNDGIPNFLDLDSDGDGVPDYVEGADDPDHDGTPNYLDTDSNGDGIPDGAIGPVVYVDGAKTPKFENGLTWETAFTTIQAAIDAAPTGQPIQIWVAEATYIETLTLRSDMALYGGFAGTESQLADRDPAAHPTIVNSARVDDGEQSSFVVSMNGISHAQLNGFTITGANLASSTSAGILCRGLDSTNIITGCTITGNSSASMWSTQYGAAIQCLTASPSIVFCEIIDNRGDGIRCDESSPTISHCTLTGNGTSPWDPTSPPQYGAALFIGSNSQVILHDSNLKNSAYGVSISGSASSIAVTRCAISANTWAGIYALGESPVQVSATFQYCRILNNNCGIRGGGVASLVITNSVIAKSNQEGLICQADSLLIDGCTVSDNGSHGIALSASDQTVTNTIIASNKGYGITSPDFPRQSISHCLFYQNLSGVLIDQHSEQTYASARELELVDPYARSNADGDPKFTDASAPDYHLLDGSAALDRAQLDTAIARDIDGVERAAGDGRADIGAYEADPEFAPPLDSTTPESRVNPPIASGTVIMPVPWTAGDGQSGVATIALYYRRNGGQWIQYPGAFTENPIQFDTSVTGGDGEYEFYTVATDSAGNQETNPITVAQHSTVITTFTGERIYVKADAPLYGSGQAWLTAIRSIRSAIALAQAHDIHEIWVAEGVYPEMITLSSNLALYGGFVGDEASIAQRDWEAHASVIDVSHAINDAPAPNAVILYQVTASRIDGFTITGSAKPNPPLPTSHLEWNIPEANLGGGVFCRELDGSNTIANCKIQGNVAHSGGGVYCYSATPEITDCVISGNSVAPYITSASWYREGDGGGIWCNLPTPITRCSIQDNSAQGAYRNSEDHYMVGGNGGGVYGGILVDCTISGNAAESGAGCSDSTSLDRCVVENNAAVQSGGGIDRTPATDCVIQGNSANYGGGAASGALLRCKLLNNIAVYNGGGCSSSDVTQCVFEANTAETGGGMYGYQAERCVFRNNSANSGGAVAYAISYTAPCYSSTGPLKGPTNCLFTGNHADAGAVWSWRLQVAPPTGCGMDWGPSSAKQEYPLGYLSASLNTFWGNISTNGDVFDHTGNSRVDINLTGCIIRENSSNNFAGSITYSNVQGGHDGEGNIDLPARFVDEDHGDFNLRPDSPCIDAVPAGQRHTHDMLGVYRPTGGAVDMGAFEFAELKSPSLSTVVDIEPIYLEGVITIPWSAMGQDAEIAYVSLYYRHNGGGWTNYPGHFTGAFLFDPTLAQGDGYYEFYTLATDINGVQEAPPNVPDAATSYITSFSGARVYVSKTGGGGSGLDWAHAFRTLEAGLAVVNKHKVKELWIGEGDYITEPITYFDGLKICGGFDATENSLADRSIASHPTTLHRDISDSAVGQTSPMVVMDGAGNVGLDGIALDGRSSQRSAETGIGLRAHDTAGANTIANCSIRDSDRDYTAVLDIQNAAFAISDLSMSGNGTTPSIRLTDGNFRMSHCQVSRFAAMTVEQSSLVMDTCRFLKTAGLASRASDTEIVGSAFEEGTESVSAQGGVLRMRDCVIDKNSEWFPTIRLNRVSDSSITNCVISRCSNLRYGAIISCEYASSPTIANCTIVGNASVGYGALRCREGSSPTVINTIFASNSGGALYTDDAASQPTLIACLFHGNPDGDVVRNGAGTYTGAAAIDANVPGAQATLDSDPRFVLPEADNYHLAGASPAIDAGTSNGAPSADIEGVARPYGAGFDIGAYEYTPPQARDVDGDNAINAVDIQLVINAALNLGAGANCDFDGNAVVDAIDIQLVINAALGAG